MCLAVPGEILTIDESDPMLRNARVSFGGIIKKVSLAMVPEAQVGQYALVHAGLAIGLLDEEDARQLLEDLKRLAADEAAGEPGA